MKTYEIEFEKPIFQTKIVMEGENLEEAQRTATEKLLLQIHISPPPRLISAKEIGAEAGKGNEVASPEYHIFSDSTEPPKAPAPEICPKCGEDKNRPVKPIVLDDNPLSVASYEDEKCEECGRIPEKKGEPCPMTGKEHCWGDKACVDCGQNIDWKAEKPYIKHPQRGKTGKVDDEGFCACELEEKPATEQENTCIQCIRVYPFLVKYPIEVLRKHVQHEVEKARKEWAKVKVEVYCTAHGCAAIRCDTCIKEAVEQALQEKEMCIAVELEKEARVQMAGGYKETALKIRTIIIPIMRREMRG